jgi:hypothetical protein
MAGEFDVNAEGVITTFRNFSGHYWPQPDPNFMDLEEISRAAFARHGLPDPIKWVLFDKYPSRS